MEIRVTVAEDEYLLWSADNPFSVGVMKCSKDTPYIDTILSHLSQGQEGVVTGFSFDSETLDIIDVVRSSSVPSSRPPIRA